MDITLMIAIIGCVIGVLSFAFNRGDKNNNQSYRQGQIDAQLTNILSKLETIEKKLDKTDKETNIKIEEAMEHHIKEYHNKGV